LFLIIFDFCTGNEYHRLDYSTDISQLSGAPQSEFIYEGSEIRLRHYFYHNDAGLLVKTIMDDGYRTDPNCLDGVTERHITNIVYSFASTLQPTIEYVQETFLDLKTEKEKQLKKTKYVYNDHGKVIEQKIYGEDDRYVYSLYSTYDAAGRAASWTEADGTKKLSEYDNTGNLIAQTTLRLNEVIYYKHYQYDERNRIIREEELSSDGTKSQTSYVYDDAGNKIASYDKFGNETLYEYDQKGNLVTLIQPAVLDPEGMVVNPTWRYVYNENNLLIAAADPNGFETRTAYYENGKPAILLYPDGCIESYAYDTDDALLHSVSKNKSYTDYTRDYLGRILSTQTFTAEGIPDTFVRNSYSAFHVLTQEDAKGNLTRYSYDKAGRLLSVVQKGENIDTFIEYTYDTLGQVKSIKEGTTAQPDQGTLTLTIRESDNIIKEIRIEDLKGNLLQTSKPAAEEKKKKNDLKTEVYDYINDRGQAVMQIIAFDEEGGITTTTFDALGRIEKMFRKTPYGNLICQLDFRYDPAGNKVKEIKTFMSGKGTPLAETTIWRYGPNNRIEEMVEAEGTPQQQSTYYQYGSWGQLEQVINPDGAVHSHEYDGCGRLVKYTASNHAFGFAYTYDASGKLSFVHDLENGEVLPGGNMDDDQENGESSGFSWRQAWNSLTSAVEKSWKAIKNMAYKALYLLNFEVSIVNFVMQQFETIAHFVLGKGFFDILGFHTHPIITGTYGDKEINDKVRITLINGILNLRADHHDVLNLLSRSHGGCRVHYVFRANYGWTGDLARCAMSKMGFISNEARMLAQLWKQMIAEMGGIKGQGVIIHYAHSIGGTETDSARRLLTPDEQKMIRIITFGSATMIPNEGFQSVVNYVSRRDGVSLLDPKGYIKGLISDQSHVVFLGTYLNVPFVDHTLLGDTYKRIIELLGRQFVDLFMPAGG
jgi:YD repeat-containing protein